RYNQQAIWVCLKGGRNLSIREAIHSSRSQCRLPSLILVFSREPHNRLVRAMPVCKALVNCIVIFDTARNTGADDHSTGLPTNFSFGDDLLVEMLDNHFCFLGNRIRITFYEGTQLLLRSLFVEHWIILHCFHELI